MFFHVSCEGLPGTKNVTRPDKIDNLMFRRCVIFAETYGDEFHPLALVALRARFHGAKLVESLEPAVTHVLLHSADADDAGKLEGLKEVRRNRREKFHIVNDEWVEQSLERASCLPEQEFEL